MALILCQECRWQISDQAGSCPNCGCPVAATRPLYAVKEIPERSITTRPKSHEGASPDEVATGPWDEPQPVRPRWPYFIFAIYLFLVTVIFLAPVAMAAVEGRAGFAGFIIIGVVYVLFVALGGSLMAIPITRDWMSPGKRGSIVLPLIGSVFCAVILLSGAALASLEF